MRERLSELLDATSRAARNPLGVIGLFIALVYGIAGLVLGFSAQYLPQIERLLLIAFLVVFPFAILGVFFCLVARHHWKLYAPRDFPSTDAFIQLMTPAQYQERLQAEVEELENDEKTAAEGSVRIGMGVEGECSHVQSRSRVRQDYALAEDLAIREIEAEFGVPVQRNLAVGHLLLDGLAPLNGVLTAVEVKFVRGNEWRRRAREAAVQAASLDLPQGMPLMIALVVSGASAADMHTIWSDYTRTTGLWQTGRSKNCKVYDFEELKAKYGFQ